MGSCGKIRFVNRKEAKKWIKEVNRKGEVILTDCYYCPNCLGWHTTSLHKEAARKFGRYLNNKNKSPKK